MKITPSELSKICKILLDALEDGEICFHPKGKDEEIIFCYDYYWDTWNRDKVFDDPETCIGSIEHDLERIRQLLQGEHPLSEYFRWLGSVFIAIADTLHRKSD